MMTIFKFQKSIQLLNYFAEREGGKLNKLKALKLVWAAERYNLRNFGSSIVNDDFFAMKLGPVPSFTKDMAEGLGTLSDEEAAFRNEYIETISSISFKSNKPFDGDFFSRNALVSMEKSYEFFGKYDGFQLADITHLYPEWSKFAHLIPNVSSRFDMSYLDFFGDPKDQPFEIFNQNREQLDYLKEYFIDQQELNRAVYSI